MKILSSKLNEHANKNKILTKYFIFYFKFFKPVFVSESQVSLSNEAISKLGNAPFAVSEISIPTLSH